MGTLREIARRLPQFWRLTPGILAFDAWIGSISNQISEMGAMSNG